MRALHINRDISNGFQITTDPTNKILLGLHIYPTPILM